jgi:hypothetical protein
MAKKIIVHAGFHKTGTTAIQSSFFAATKELEKAGITYPHVGGKAHHKAISSLMGKTWGWEDRGGVPATDKKWQEFLTKIKRAKGTALISSEFLCELDDEQIAKFKRDIAVDDVKIYFTLRPLLKIIPSAYQQHLKIGIKSNYEKWLHSILDEPGVSTITPSFWVRHMHSEVLAKWAKHFGKENVFLIAVDEMQPQFIYDQFNKVFELNPDFLKPQNDQDSNRSLTLNEIELLRAVNKKFPKKRSWHDYETFIRNGAFKYLTNKVVPGPEEARLLTPQWAVDIAEFLSLKSVKEIKELGITIIGDLDSFKEARIAIGENSDVKMIPVELAAKALIAMDLGVVEKLPTAYVARTLWKMAKRDLRAKIKFKR